MTLPVSHRFCVAPMMDWTDRHERFLLRLCSRRALLYTEMVVADALLYGDRERFLAYDKAEHPLGLQIGGSDPDKMARCAELGEEAGFDEINMNVGCPSSRVQAGRFGACLMAEPMLVRDCFQAMQSAVRIPVTVKCRIGIDDQDDYAFVAHFVEVVAQAGCYTVIVHARKAYLKGLSPKQNREIPPLRHDIVYRLKRNFPDLRIVINGGIQTLSEVAQHLKSVDGVMIGREAYRDPYLLTDVDSLIFDEDRIHQSRWSILAAYKTYIADQLERGVYLKHMTRHLLGFFHGEPGARAWRSHIGRYASDPRAGGEVIEEAERKVQAALGQAA